MLAQWETSCSQWAGGEKMCHLDEAELRALCDAALETLDAMLSKVTDDTCALSFPVCPVGDVIFAVGRRWRHTNKNVCQRPGACRVAVALSLSRDDSGAQTDLVSSQLTVTLFE